MPTKTPNKSLYTTGEIAALYGVPPWAARRAIDAVGEAIPRAGLYRLVPARLLEQVKLKLQESGHLPAGGPNAA
jgi:hypothetical protein